MLKITYPPDLPSLGEVAFNDIPMGFFMAGLKGGEYRVEGYLGRGLWGKFMGVGGVPGVFNLDYSSKSSRHNCLDRWADLPETLTFISPIPVDVEMLVKVRRAG